MSNDATRHNTTPTHLTDTEWNTVSREIPSFAFGNGFWNESRVRAAVDRVLAARGSNTAHETLQAAVEAVTECPHGPRHYYAADATCQRCEMPSWVESLVRAALSPAPTNKDEFVHDADWKPSETRPRCGVHEYGPDEHPCRTAQPGDRYGQPTHTPAASEGES